MDRTDLKILAILQEDASLPVAEVAARVNLSQTPCWRRIQRLERNGVIERRVALVNPEAVGLGLSVFVEIEAGGPPPRPPGRVLGAAAPESAAAGGVDGGAA